MKKRQGINHIETLQDNLEQLRVVCSCGHTIRIPVYIDTIICRHCGNKVRNNTKAYFIYNLRKKLNRGGKSKNNE